MSVQQPYHNISSQLCQNARITPALNMRTETLVRTKSGQAGEDRNDSAE
jgi:hypothetical protein